jgi:alkane 1-monooxygenase
MDDYLSRYGLQRQKQSDGRHEPLGPRHVWAAPEPSAFGRAAGRSGTFVAGPVYPRPLPVMAILAMVPHLWSAEMDVRVLAMIKAARDARHPGSQTSLAAIPMPRQVSSAGTGAARRTRMAQAARL